MTFDSSNNNWQPPSKGTKDITFIPYVATDGSKRQLGTSIIFQEEFRRYSLEELRHTDYKDAGIYAKRATKELSNQFSPWSYSPGISHQTTNGKEASTYEPVMKGMPLQTRQNLHLLRGEVIQVLVGPLDQSNRPSETWSLPKALLSAYSPFLKESCERGSVDQVPEDQESRKSEIRKIDQIDLPEEEPIIFDLFVEWMIYGAYTMPTGSKASKFVHVDAAAWTLGDRLRATEFQNYTMGRIYEQHTRDFANIPVTPARISFACTNSAKNSLLRKFFLDFIVTYYGDTARVKGTVGGWNLVFQTHADVRSAILAGFSVDRTTRKALKAAEDYMYVKKRKIEIVARPLFAASLQKGIPTFIFKSKSRADSSSSGDEMEYNP